MSSKLAGKESEKQKVATPPDGIHNAKVSSLYGNIQQNIRRLGCVFLDSDTGANYDAKIQKSTPSVEGAWMEKIVFGFVDNRALRLEIQNGEIISVG